MRGIFYRQYLVQTMIRLEQVPMQQPLLATFESELSRWRQHRQLSQLALSLEANVSQRHVSYLETGRAKPSREMLIRLCDAMTIPFRERNQLLTLAGFSALYEERPLDAPTMQPILKAIESMLNAHDPLPAIVVDRFWNVIKQNQAAQNWFSALTDTPKMQKLIQQEGAFNLALLTMHPDGLRQYIDNWHQVFPLFVRRLIQEVKLSGDREVQQKLLSYLSLSEIEKPESADNQQALMPVVPLILSIGERKLSLFSIISTIGTAQDITADELRVESFYPADDQTAEYFTGL